MGRNYYEILGLRATATQEEIKGAFRKKARESHPDVNDFPDATERFVEINEAYAILGDRQKRMVYNQKLRDQAAIQAGRSYANNVRAKEEAYRQWVQNARAQADAHARMSYEEFNKSRFVRTEATVFHYMQVAIMLMGFAISALIFFMPFLAMVLIHWSAVVLAVVFVPLSFRAFKGTQIGLNELTGSYKRPKIH